MGYVATTLARLRVSGFKWYVFFLEDCYEDALRRELSDNFEKLAGEIGPDSLVVRGADREHFWSDVFVTYAIHGRGMNGDSFPLPGLLITDTAVSDIEKDRAAAERAKIILISLAERYRKPGSVTEILKQVSKAVRDPAAMRVLETPDHAGIHKYWGWVARYLELKPSFCGFGVNLNAIVEEQLMGRKAG